MLGFGSRRRGALSPPRQRTSCALGDPQPSWTPRSRRRESAPPPRPGGPDGWLMIGHIFGRPTRRSDSHAPGPAARSRSTCRLPCTKKLASGLPGRCYSSPRSIARRPCPRWASGRDVTDRFRSELLYPSGGGRSQRLTGRRRRALRSRCSSTFAALPSRALHLGPRSPESQRRQLPEPSWKEREAARGHSVGRTRLALGPAGPNLALPRSKKM